MRSFLTLIHNLLPVSDWDARKGSEAETKPPPLVSTRTCSGDVAADPGLHAAPL